MFRRLVLVVSLLLLVAGCQVSESAPQVAPADLVDARDRAIEFVQLRFRVGLGPQMQWDEARVASEDAADWIEYQYSALPWLVTVGGPVTGSGVADYDVVITNPGTGFMWEGRIATDGEVAEGGGQVLAACDTTCEYLAGCFAELGFNDLEWTGRRVTPDDLVGAETYKYTADDWLLIVTFPIVAPEATVYHVTLENQETGFVWEGEMDSDRNLTETNDYSRVPSGD